MSHAEKCPICNGKGKINRNYNGGWITNSSNHLKKCHGCNGLGWITVQDQHPIFTTNKQR